MPSATCQQVIAIVSLRNSHFGRRVVLEWRPMFKTTDNAVPMAKSSQGVTKSQVLMIEIGMPGMCEPRPIDVNVVACLGVGHRSLWFETEATIAEVEVECGRWIWGVRGDGSFRQPRQSVKPLSETDISCHHDSKDTMYTYAC